MWTPISCPDSARRWRTELSRSGENPFERKRRGMVVAPRSGVALTELADVVRAAFTPPDQVMFPVMDVLDRGLVKHFPEYDLLVLEESVMGAFEGLVFAGDNNLHLRNDVYEAACTGDGRARFTACHELAHYLLHRTVAMARVRDDEPIYVDAEWQANCFAGALLMTKRHAVTFTSVEDAAEKCGMSPTAARYQLMKYGRHF